jgi:hypothetical protein
MDNLQPYRLLPSRASALRSRQFSFYEHWCYRNASRNSSGGMRGAPLHPGLSYERQTQDRGRIYAEERQLGLVKLPTARW